MTATIPRPHNTRTAQCARCGVMRQINGTRMGVLCPDCWYALNKTERKAWNR